MKQCVFKKIRVVITAIGFAICVAGCRAESAAAFSSGQTDTNQSAASNSQKTEIQVFIAASLNTVMTDLAQQYQLIHPEVTIQYNADSSGKLLAQIEEGFSCDVFFSAAQQQMDTLEKQDQLLIEGTRKNVVSNQVVVISLKGSNTKVTGLETLKNAKSIALADGSVPVGKYTRKALVATGILPPAEDAGTITGREISDALGGVEISEQSNVSKTLAAVAEGSCEVGTVYYSDLYGYENQLDVLEYVPDSLTGKIIYPIAQIRNDEADDAEVAAAKSFIEFVTSDEAKEVFHQYYFGTDLE